MSLLIDTIRKEQAEVETVRHKAESARRAAHARRLTEELMKDLAELEPKLAPNGDIHISDGDNFYCRILVDSTGYRIARYEDTDDSGAASTFTPDHEDKERLIRSVIDHLPHDVVQRLSMKIEPRSPLQVIADMFVDSWYKLKSL
ncbi:hypothetical protein [Solemya elarraichensis gill symbiont]|uniref:Uncharacterized protein n=1 Tax=Solemya elarraichensis gill symbiont TaxID=1918949 RepID=A0A1T2L5K4_9GAMM|nr:hypothetical protein [Solemya elarraichensis gill symbiont]OOZ40351.1 hypothetical protein BOW52_06015 [Solemya elarraichensis gill symbiont]